jgi:hypothetical protein
MIADETVFDHAAIAWRETGVATVTIRDLGRLTSSRRPLWKICVRPFFM